PWHAEAALGAGVLRDRFSAAVRGWTRACARRRRQRVRNPLDARRSRAGTGGLCAPRLDAGAGARTRRATRSDSHRASHAERPLGAAATPAAFDAVAHRYDAEFSDRWLGETLRRQVWRELAPLVKPGSHVLDLGCGTGEDAVWLAGRGARVCATDASTE